MKVQHSTTIELNDEVSIVALKRALDEIPDSAHVSTDVRITEADRPWESRRTSVSLLAVWEVEPPQ